MALTWGLGIPRTPNSAIHLVAGVEVVGANRDGLGHFLNQDTEMWRLVSDSVPDEVHDLLRHSLRFGIVVGVSTTIKDHSGDTQQTGQLDNAPRVGVLGHGHTP